MHYVQGKMHVIDAADTEIMIRQKGTKKGRTSGNNEDRQTEGNDKEMMSTCK